MSSLLSTNKWTTNQMNDEYRNMRQKLYKFIKKWNGWINTWINRMYKYWSISLKTSASNKVCVPYGFSTWSFHRLHEVPCQFFTSQSKHCWIMFSSFYSRRNFKTALLWPCQCDNGYFARVPYIRLYYQLIWSVTKTFMLPTFLYCDFVLLSLPSYYSVNYSKNKYYDWENLLQDTILLTVQLDS